MVVVRTDTQADGDDVTVPPVTFAVGGPYLRTSGSREPLAAEVSMNTVSANFPELSILLALLLSVVFWNVVRLVLAVLAAGFVLLVIVGMAGYGVVELLTQ